MTLKEASKLIDKITESKGEHTKVSEKQESLIDDVLNKRLSHGRRN